MDSSNLLFDHAAPNPVRTRIEALYSAIAQREPTLHAFTELCRDAALARASELDGMPSDRRGPLHGLPVAVKEVMDVAGRRCEWGSAIHVGRRPATTAPLVQRLIELGAVVVGMTATMEYAIAAAAPTTHPADPARTPGGSSSGSAAAVGAGLIPLALGTQTIGSIIRPAGYCGVVGYKPSYGQYPTDGILSLSPMLDHPGLIADTVATVAETHRALTGTPDTAPVLRGLRFLPPWYAESTADVVLTVLAGLKERLSDPFPLKAARPVDQDIVDMEAETTHRLLTYDLARIHGAEVKAAGAAASGRLRELVADGDRITAAGYAEACARRAVIVERLHALLDPGEVAVAPATVDLAPPRREGTGSRAPQRLWTLAGMPTLTLPVAEVQGLPVGVQLIARHGEDALLLATARHIETLLERRRGG